MMKSILIISLCLLFALSVQAQTTKEDETEAKVVKLTLAKEDADGNIIEDPEFFGTKDIPIHCYIDLNAEKPTLVKMRIIAIKAKGLRPNSQVVAVQYKTKNGEYGVSFNASPGKIWAEGDYKVEVYLNGKLAESREFKVTVQSNSK